LYKIYLERRKNGTSKSDAKYFDESFFMSDERLSKWSYSDIDECLTELRQHNYVKVDVCGNVTLLDSTIVYMENRFKKGLMEVLEFISKFMP
jgi:hypothetical protein